jgi:hypothetical protein
MSEVEGPERCGLCGRDPALGFGSVWDGDEQVWLCHPDDFEKDCYFLWTVEGRRVQMELVMPFVCCSSNGGAYDDHPFVAGVKYGEMSYILRTEKPAEWQGYMPPELVAQCDLVAMKEGYSMTAEPWEEAPDEHVLVTLTKGKETGR